jgi:hypothetical protein
MLEQQHTLEFTPLYRGETLQDRFERFHAANPEVYRSLVRLARQAAARGHRRIGIGMLFEVLRWEHALQTSEEFKLNNSYRSRYVRLIEANEADLRGLFETRSLLT